MAILKSRRPNVMQVMTLRGPHSLSNQEGIHRHQRCMKRINLEKQDLDESNS